MNETISKGRLKPATFVGNIYLVASEKGINLGVLERSVGVSVGYLSRLKKRPNSSVRLYVASAFADALGVPLDYLLREHKREVLPDRITRIDVAKVERAARKMCRCADPCYSVDVQNRLIYCAVCGAIVDPFEAMKYIATHYDRVNDAMEKQLEERRQIDSYKPRLVVLKKLEKLVYHHISTGMSPTCPLCGKPFDLEELLTVKWKEKTTKEGRN